MPRSDPSPAVTRRAAQTLRALGRSITFFLKVFPMLPSRPVDWVTKRPVVETARYPTLTGFAQGDLYRPPTPGPHPGVVVCLGVVPFEVDHPQVPVLGKALARAGFAALLYWSPAMRDFRLEPGDVENIALAYDWLIAQPFVDPARSGLLGTCVGGAFGLMAAASPRIRERVAFASAYAPFSSMPVFAREIASASRCNDGLTREPWTVDPLTRKVFVHSLTGCLEAGEAERLNRAFMIARDRADGRDPFADGAAPVVDGLSERGQAVYRLLAAQDYTSAGDALAGLPADISERLEALSPLRCAGDIRARQIILLHDAGDLLIPAGESRRLVAALSGREGLRYTEMNFSHLDPVKGRLPLLQMARELGKFYRAVYPIFYQAAA